MKKNFQVEAGFLGAAIASLFAVAPLSAAAQDVDVGTASGIPWGPIVAYPEGTVTVKRNNNIYAQPRGEKSDTITVLAPKLKLEAKDGPHTYDITARVEDGRYSNKTSADYTDFGLAANAQWVFSGRAGLRLTAEYLDGHDEQGAVPGVGFHTKPDDWHQTSFTGLAGYGAEGAQGRIEVDFGLISKEYDNFKRDMFGNPDNLTRDYDTARLGGTFFWRVMPKTQLLFRAARANLDYDQKSFTYAAGPRLGTVWTNLDSTETTYQVGVTWEATALTTGIFKIGRTNKDYSRSNLDDTSDMSWDAIVRWSPLTYSIFEFTTGQSPQESNLGNSSLETRYGVVWNHAWNSRLSTSASYKYVESDYQYNPGTLFQQNDKTDTFNIGLDYRWSRIIKVGAGYEYTDRSSNSRRNEYKRDIFGIFLNAAL